MKIVARVSNWLGRFSNWAGLLGMVVMTVIVIWQVIGREFFNTSADWREELARFLFVFACYITVGICWKDQKHLKVDAVIDRIHGKARSVLLLIFQLTVIFIAILWLWCGIALMKTDFFLPEIAHGFEIQWEAVHWIIPLGMLLLLFFSIEHFIKSIRSVRLQSKK